MAVHVKCSRPYNIDALKAIIERCGGRGPSPPRCPPINKSSDRSDNAPPIYSQNGSIDSNSGSSGLDCRNPRSCGSSSRRRNDSSASKFCAIPCCMISCPPCPFIRPTCTGYPCVNFAPFPKPVPAPLEPPRPLLRTRINAGGLFYTGAVVSYPPSPQNSSPSPRCLPCGPVPRMTVSC